MMLSSYNQRMTVLGTVTAVNPDPNFPSFTLKARSGDVVEVHVSETTWFSAMQNLDRVDRDRLVDPVRADVSGPAQKVLKYAVPGRLLVAEGIYQVHDGKDRFDAKQVKVLYSQKGWLLFEHTHWWITQISAMADKWLDDLFGEQRSYTLDDFAKLYRTNLNIVGLPTDDNVQEMSTLSRLIYGLSSAYLMSGDQRYYLAAKAGVEFQRESFRSLSTDGRYCFWASGRRRLRYGTTLLLTSENPDDYGTVPLYEQIYALAGLSQFYRISADWQVLHDIRRTVAMFEDFYRDKSPLGGYFSHLDFATFSPHDPNLGVNRSKKNWNSIGDHLPAYLVNLLLALDPLPIGREKDLEGFRNVCLDILTTTSGLIVDKFPDKDPNIPYVNERFDAEWNPDHTMLWQQNRGVVGHNLKIAWNLTRVAHYYNSRGNSQQAARLMTLAERLGHNMGRLGLDQLRGGVFDVVERQPKNGMPLEFYWSNDKVSWQQEQAILAYLIMHGYTGNADFLTYARETMVFWNLYFIDRDRSGIFFTTYENGQPVIEGAHSQKGSHTDQSYHSFELNYLTHTYSRAYLYKERREDNVFCVHFRPHVNSGQRSINVLPDFFSPGEIEVVGIVVNGIRRTNFDPHQYQVPLDPSELGGELIVELCPTVARNEKNKHASQG
jgi:mannose/cellobiose epimerase-like protein (N-acyl-D-glucosamine 2-epimerase family)